MSIASVNFQIQQIMNSFYASKKALGEPVEAPDPFNKAPPRNVRSYRQNASDVQADSTQTARHIGDLTRGKTRLNIISALTNNDFVDFYRFKATTEGKLAVSVTSDKGVSVQLIRRNGTIIADSAATYGEKADNYQKLSLGKLEVDAGDYYLKVTRLGDRSERPNYAIQLSMSQYYEQDYDTVESPAAGVAGARVSVQAQNAGAINDVLNTLGLGGLFDFKA